MQNFASTIRNGSTLHKILFTFLFVAALLAIPVGIGRADSPSNRMPMVIPTSMPEPDVDDISYNIDADQVTGSAVIPAIIPPVPEPDADGDGIPYSIECADTLGILVDMDSDGLENCNDFDSDGDGLSDRLESRLLEVIASQTGVPVNTDGDAQPDYLDKDSDNDGISDTIEAFGLDDNNQPNVTASGVDANNNGMDDAFEAVDVTFHDRDNDGIVAWLDADEGPFTPTADAITPEPSLHLFYLPIVLQ